ncbi:MAG TPA: rhodanese-like domain-containing protein [Bacillota bacterium]|nr:rhodanese-like domain-containing protein [Bacillota bacterium]
MRSFHQISFLVGFLTWGFFLISPAGAVNSDTVSPALKIQAMACGAGHSLILLNDGTVWGCGANEYGQLGDGTGVNQRVPVKASPLADVTAIACGPYFSLALKKDGTVWGWGLNEDGLLGTGNIPVKIPGLKNITSIACGRNQAFAIKKDGTVWAWGSNSFGQLGDGTYQDRKTPFKIKGLNKIKAIACGLRHTVALKADGSLWVWGSNGSGQLGDGTREAQLKPVPVPGLSEVVGAACGSENTVVLKKDGTVFSWGANGSGQLGDGTKTEKLRPVQVLELNEVTTIASGTNFNIALKKDGTLWGWGSDIFGELGDGKAVESVDECIPCGGKNNVYYYDKPKPVSVTEGNDVIMITCGSSHAMMVKADGTVWSWGLNNLGQLAEGSAMDRMTPVQNFFGRVVGKMVLQYQNITALEAKTRLEREDVVLLDVRTPEEYQQKHLQNSILIPLNQLENEIITRIPQKNTPIMVYCKAGSRSAKAAEALVKLGYDNVSNILGGIDGWPYEVVIGNK